MILEILKIVVVTLLGGGVAGAFIGDWLHRRNARLQPIPLIERVNRLVSPELKGFTLARFNEIGKLEEINKVREYQLTLRNTSSVHLHDAEVQFEFPSVDVEAWAGRPVRSKTSPIPIDAVVSKPWKEGFRWRIPELPSSDSIEFTFRAVDPSSDDYEVALYNGGQVVIEKAKGEPATNGGKRSLAYLASIVAFAAFITSLLGLFASAFAGQQHTKTYLVEDGGCSLKVSTEYTQVITSWWPWKGPWKISSTIENIGNQECVVQPDPALGKLKSLSPDDELFLQTMFSDGTPSLARSPIIFAPPGANGKATPHFVDLYGPNKK